ncbi:hypothetical protein BDV98DRAFT_574730 [Pterulicium gracile]|uniref:Extracellular membrane protein CFEM domain-containing protein n=1 Tax=Pterulicium gracile TaxID=1884261 RepID=A0A5C3Q6D8_9AGAR|nr:hypothetical protein BDV98DRAFT_574730 [Pterula gracilis]
MMFSSTTFVKGLLMALFALPALAQISAEDGNHTPFRLVRGGAPPAPPAQLAAIPEACLSVCNEGRTVQTQSIKDLVYGVKPAQPCAANDTACLCTAFDDVLCSCNAFNGNLNALSSCLSCYHNASTNKEKEKPILEGLMDEIVGRCTPVGVPLVAVPLTDPTA